MPIIKSAIKRARQTIKRRARNMTVKRAVKGDTRALLDAISVDDVEATASALREAISELDRAVKKGTLHKNTAARRKSRLTKQANQVTGTASAKSEKPKTPKAKPAAAKTTKKPVARKTAAKKPAAKKPAKK